MRPNRNWPPMLQAFLLLAALYGLVTLAAWAFQGRLLYFPRTQGWSQLQRQAEATGLAPWPAGAGEEYLALGPAARGTGRESTVVVFHGNAGSAVDRAYYHDALGPRGMRVLVAEYPGYGARPGKPGERSMVADGVELVREVREQFDGPVLLWGESMGAAVAAGVTGALRDAGDEPPAGVVLLMPWDDLPSLAQASYPFLPARWLVRDRFDIAAGLEGFGGPVAVLLAEEDRVIPNSHSLRSYEELAQPKRRWTFSGAGHNSWPAEAGAGWWDEVLGFLREGSGAMGPRTRSPH